MNNYFLFAVGAAVLFAACEPQPVDPPPPPPVLVSDSSFVASVVQLDTTRTPGQDTTLKLLFFYDTQKRVSRVEGHYLQQGTPAYSISKKEYFYLDNDSLPEKLVATFPDGSGTTSFFTYKGWWIEKDSTIHYRNGTKVVDFVTTYNKLDDKRYFVYTLRTDHPGTTTAVDSAYCTRNWVNGNLLSGTDSVYYCSSGTQFDGLWVDTFQTSFDDRFYPFNRLTLPYPVFTRVRHQSVFGMLGINNQLQRRKVTKTQSGLTYTETAVYSYKYRSDGLPIEINMGEDYFKGYYKRLITYTKL